MIINPKQGVSVHRLIKSLIRKPSSFAKVEFGNGVVHSFRVIENSQRVGWKYVLEYCAEDRKWKYLIDWRPSNLPGVEGVRYYLFDPRSDMLVQKLHLGRFLDGVFFFIRHRYRHIYSCQDYGRKCYLKFHDYEQKYNDLVNSKRKLRYEYGGKLTRTAKRLFHYQDMIDHYDQMSLDHLRTVVDRLQERAEVKNRRFELNT